MYDVILTHTIFPGGKKMKKFTKTIFIVLALLILIGTVSSAAPKEPVSVNIDVNQWFSQYDVYRDGVIDMTDLAIMQSFFGQSLSQNTLFDPYILNIADFNQDGVVDIDDINEVAMRYNCMISQPCYW